MSKKMQKILMIGVLLFSLWSNALFALAAELTVTQDNVRIRSEASTSGDIVGSTQSGKKYTSEGEATDSAGMKWYKIPVDGNTYGYIRSDMVEVSGESTGGGQAAVPPATNPTPIAEQQATVSQSSVKIRSGASVDHTAVGSLTSGSVITLIGEATDNTGKKWYQMKAISNGQEISGYVRYDLITIGAVNEPAAADPADGGSTGDEPQTEDPAEVPDETGGEPAEGTEPDVQDTPTEPANTGMDYEIVYKADDQGAYQYYLYDHVSDPAGATVWAVTDVMAAINYVTNNTELDNKQLSNQKIIIIVLAVVIVALVLIVSVLLFKIRDLYDDYDEEEEEEYTQGRRQGPPGEGRREAPVRQGPGIGPQRTVRQPGDQPQGRPRPTQSRQSQGQGRPPQNGERRRGPQTREPELHADAELRAAERSERMDRPMGKSEDRPMPARKPQNFLSDDDEFEFEFLNMDDKDMN